MILAKVAAALALAGLTTLALKIMRDIYKHEAYKAYESASGEKLKKIYQAIMIWKAPALAMAMLSMFSRMLMSARR